MAFKLRAPDHNNFYILIFLLLLHVSTSWAQVVLSPQSETLQVLVPNKTSFQEFVDCSNGPTAVGGFSIDVFQYALSILIPKPNWTNINYTCYDFGSSRTYDNMVNELQSNESSVLYDVVVGDITISAARMQNASFTQSYLDSGIVLLTPAKGGVFRGFPGVFFAPFTSIAWFIVIVSTILTGLSLSLIERIERQSSQLQFIIRFFMWIVMIFDQESHRGSVSKIVIVAWTVFILLLGSSYTASLSSILTVNELSTDIRSLDDLKSKNLSIGYHSTLIVKDYLELKKGITKLVELRSSDDYTVALSTRQVAAIAEETPYVSLFLADQSASECKFLVSPMLTIGGFGFAFRDESLSSAFSVAILNLSEGGQLQRLRKGWNLADFRCSSQIQSTQLDVNSSLGLFLLLGSAFLFCMFLFGLKKMTGPCLNGAYLRLRGNQQREVVDVFWERSVHGFTKSSSFARHRTTP